MPWYVNPLFAQAAQAEQSSIPWYVHLLVAVGTLAVSFFLGEYLGKKLRMPDHGWKIGVCLFSLLASSAIVLMGPPFKLGVDLSGGVILVYEVDQTQKKRTSRRRHGQAGGGRGPPREPRRTKGSRPSANTASSKSRSSSPRSTTPKCERIERIISTTGELQFRILANNRDNKRPDRARPGRSVEDPNSRCRRRSAGLVGAGRGQRKEQFRQLSRDRPPHPASGRPRSHGNPRRQRHYNVTGAYLTRADVGTDQKGQPCVNFSFNNAGGQLFGELTGRHLPDKIDRIHLQAGRSFSTTRFIRRPRSRARSPISGEITGSFTRQEVQDLVNVLNAGSLPAALTKEPISKLFTRPHAGTRHDRQEHPRDAHRRRFSCRCSCSGTTASAAWWPTSPWC